MRIYFWNFIIIGFLTTFAILTSLIEMAQGGEYLTKMHDALEHGS